jgi:predicted small lipoprotein YifL
MRALGLPVLTAALCGLAVLAGCGQKGGLYLPTDPAARNRATLPQTVSPLSSSPSLTTPTVTPPAAPVSAAQ